MTGVYSGRTRYHPYSSGKPNPFVQPRPAGGASAPGTPFFDLVVSSCTQNATPTTPNKLRIDTGSWPVDGCLFCGYTVNITTPLISGDWLIDSIESDLGFEDTLVFLGNPFGTIGVSAAYTIDVMFNAAVAFPTPPAEFLHPSIDFEIIDANTIELQEPTIYDYQGAVPAWFNVGIDDGDLLAFDQSVSTTRNGKFGPIVIDPANQSRFTVSGGHGLAVGTDVARLIRWQRRCDADFFLRKRKGILYDWDFGNLNVANLYQDVAATIPVTAKDDPIRALVSIGSASGTPTLVRDAASTGEIRWNPNGLNGYGSAVFDGTAWFVLAAPQDSFVDSRYSILFLINPTKEVRNTALTNNICSWDILAASPKMNAYIDGVAAPERSGYHLGVAGRDLNVANFISPIVSGWGAVGISFNEAPVGSTEISFGISDANSMGTSSGVAPAPVLPNTATEDFYLGRIEGDSAADRFVGEIARMIIWDSRLTNLVWDNVTDVLEPNFIGLAMPWERLPDFNPELFWQLDFADPATLYTDTGATIPVVANNDAIAACATLGSGKSASLPNVELFINATTAERPLYKASGGARDNSYASFVGTNINLTSASFVLINADPFGIVLGVMFRRVAAVPTAQNSYILRWGTRQEIFFEQATGRVMVDAGNGAIEALPETELNQWYLVYLCADGGGNVDDAVWGSPGPEDLSPQPLPLDTVSSSTIRVGDEIDSIVDIQTVFAYSQDQDGTVRARIRDYFTRKYGALPHV